MTPSTREIFDLALVGNGISKIRKHLNKQHILRPAAYAAEQGETGYERYFADNEENRYIWSENSVRGILRSPIYAGNLAGYKRIAANMKSKKRPSKLPEEWEVIPDTHEGIVTQEEFDTVQQLMTSRRREQNAGGFENIFAGVIKCADCGYALRAMNANRRKRPDIIDCVLYSRNNYARYGRSECTPHNIEARDLFNAVLADINRFADMAVNDEKAVRAIERRLTQTDQSRAKALEKEQRKLNKRLAELDRLFSSLYEDKVMERITERNFEMMSGKYQKEQLEIEARLKEVTETLSDSYEKTQGVRDFLSLIRNYQGIKELDATIINALIDKILVSEREKIADGTVKQEIKIYYKFIGFVGELHITPTKRWTALKPKNCTVCGVEYVPRSGISKYCPACAKKIQREKSNESKRRSRERNRQACIELSAKNDRLMSDREVFLDIGAYNGDTIKLFLEETDGKYKKIIALEPDDKSFLELNEYLARERIRNVVTSKTGAWNRQENLLFKTGNEQISSVDMGDNILKASNTITIYADRLDEIFGEEEISFIKINYYEGVLEAMEGCSGILKRCHPKLAIDVGFDIYNVLKLSELLTSLELGYRLYLRFNRAMSSTFTLYAE